MDSSFIVERVVLLPSAVQRKTNTESAASKMFKIQIELFAIYSEKTTQHVILLNLFLVLCIVVSNVLFLMDTEWCIY